MMLAIGLSCVAFIMLRYIASLPSFIRALIMKGCWICWRLFLPLLRWWCHFSMLLLIYCIMSNDLHMLNHPCIPGMKSTWSWCMILLTCWISFANILWRLKRSAIIFFFCCVLVCFGDECNTSFIEWFRQCNLPFYFMDKIEECWYYLLFNDLI
jgi:hypothetical protein